MSELAATLANLDKLPKDRRDWLEVFGNQWAPTRQMPGTCEACVWGRGEHAKRCVTRELSGSKLISQKINAMLLGWHCSDEEEDNALMQAVDYYRRTGVLR